MKKLILLITLLLTLAATVPAQQFVQVSSGPSVPTLQTVQRTLTITAGTYLVFVGWNDTVANVQTISDQRGNQYVKAIGPTRGAGTTGGGTFFQSQSIYYVKNAPTGSTTVTVVFDRVTSFPDVRVVEISGADKTNPVDQAVGAAGTGTAASSGLLAVGSVPRLLVGSGTTSTHSQSAGTGFTSRVVTADGNIVEDKTVSTAGNQAATWTLPAQSNWVMQAVTLRPATQTPPPPPPPPAPGTASKGLTIFVDQHKVTLSWTASVGDGITYGIYRGTAAGGPYTRISTGIGLTTYVDTAVQAGGHYFYRVTASNSVGESDKSNEAMATVPQ